MLELHAIAMKKAEGEGDFAVAMTAAEKQRFLDGISKDYGVYYNMLGRVDVARSDCSRAADRESIHAGIRDSVGFGELGRMVFGVMEEWMVGQLRAEMFASRERGNEFDAISYNEGLSRLLSELGRDEEALELDKEALLYYKRKGGSIGGEHTVDILMMRYDDSMLC